MNKTLIQKFAERFNIDADNLFEIQGHCIQAKGRFLARHRRANDGPADCG